jgi:hypothetical protein
LGEITWGTATAVLAAPLVFLLPGWALLELLLPGRFQPERQMDPASWLALAVGLTLAVTPLSLLSLHLVGVKVGAGAVLAWLVFSALVIVWRRGPHLLRWWRTSLAWRDRLAWLDAPLLALALVMALIVGVRLWVVRGINVGFWGDSYQHTLITQLLLDNGGLFDSWAPYAPLQTFTYHFGFHSNVALFQWATAWLTGNPTPRTVVLVGQFFNALAALALYPLAVRLSSGRRWVGVGAVLIAGLLTPMPMFYVNWGRYTQLAGQVILPAAIWFTIEAVEAPVRDPRRLALAVLAVAGLALTHYFVLAFYVAFLVPYLAVWWFSHWRERKLCREGLLRVALVGVPAVLLILPWAGQMLGGLLPRILTGYMQGTPAADFIQQENAFLPLARFVPHYVAILAILGGLWALVRRERIAVLLFWVGCQFLLSNPHWLGLPGTGVLSNFTVELSLYISASILAAYLGVSVLDWAGQHLGQARPALGVAATLFLVGVAWLGVGQRKDVLDPQLQLVTPADEEAMAWIRQNTPENARFLVNFFFAYGGSLIAGSDAGWWMPLLARRQTILPPLNYGAEAGPEPDYGKKVNEVAHFLEERALDDARTVQYLGAQGIRYVFVGEKGGPLLDPVELQNSPYYRAVYSPTKTVSGPWVFEVLSP